MMNDDEQKESENSEIGDEELQDEEQIDSRDSNSDTRFQEELEGGWLEWFCRLKGNDFFVEIDSDFIRKRSNLAGLKIDQEYITMFLDSPIPDECDSSFLDNIQNIIDVYGQIHRRFIYTAKGLALVREKYLNGVYGHCPRILCCKQILLPVGLSEDLKYSRVKVFCPLCEEIYKPRRKCGDIDGAFFGIGFPHAFLLAFPDLNPKNLQYKRYIPKIAGFRVFGKYGSKYYRKDKKEFEELKKKLEITDNI
jgi:casein kinase II subunit beta